MKLNPCPCCGYLVFDEPPGSYAICPVCGWEDDFVQLQWPTMGGANDPLFMAQREFALKPPPRDLAVLPDRDPLWRPVEEGDLPADEPRDYWGGVNAAIDRPLAEPYYWRRRRASNDQ